VITLQERVHGAPRPDHWQLDKLQQVFRVRRGNKNTGMKEDNLLSLSYGRIIQKDIETADGLLPENFEGYQIVEPGNIILRLTDLQNDKRSLRQGLATQRGIITSAYDAVEIRRDNDPRFWFYSLLALDLAKHYYSLGGGVRQSVKFADFPNDWVYRPDLATQRQIADFLDRETARIDLLIEKKQRLVALLGEKYFAALESATFPVDTPSNELIPFRWICRIAEGQVDPTSEKWRRRVLIAPNHIETKTGRLLGLETAEEQGAISGKYSFGAGTVLYSKIRPALAKSCIAPSAGMCSADMYPIKPDKRLRPEYLLMQLLSARFTDWANLESMRVAMPKINRETLGGFRIRVPSLDAQEAYICSFAKDRGKFEATTDKINSSIDRLKEYRSALITTAVTGQIDVKSWKGQGKSERCLNETLSEAS